MSEPPINRPDTLNALAAIADADADRLLARGAAMVSGEDSPSLRRSSFVDALAMLELADRLRARAELETARTAEATPAIGGTA